MTAPRTPVQHSRLDYTIVIPTVGRTTLEPLLISLAAADGTPPSEVIVVDDRPTGSAPLELPQTRLPVTVVVSDGVGPVGARNAGWQRARSDWIVFLDDGVVVDPHWMEQLAEDLGGLDDTAGGSQGRIRLPRPQRHPADDERHTLAREAGHWMSANTAYRRRVLMALGGFDSQFVDDRRADADLGLRVTGAGHRIAVGERTVTRPISSAGFWRSVTAQRGNADDARMRRKHGARWRERCGARGGRQVVNVATAAVAVAGVANAAVRRRRQAAMTFAAWGGLTAAIAASRLRPGPRTRTEAASTVATSAVIPIAATASRIVGEIRARRERGGPLPAAVLVDRDDTLIVDVPDLADPDAVEPMPGALEALSILRRAGVPIGVISSQSGVGDGRISASEMEAVNRRVDDLLGPFDTWQICVHSADENCDCRQPGAGLVALAAEKLGVDPADCVVIGDVGADAGAASAAGATAILVPTDRTRPAEVNQARDGALVRGTLVEAAHTACGGGR